MPNIDFLGIINKFVLAIVIIFVGFIIGRIFGRFLLKILHEAELDAWVRKLHIRFSVEELLSRIIEIAVYVITVVLALYQLGVARLIFFSLSLFIVLVMVASLILGLRDLIPNYLAGFRIMGLVKKGNNIKMGSIEGVVERVNFIETKIRTRKGDMFLVPNSYLLKLFHRR